MAKLSFGPVDYAVICGLLSLSVGIGLYYAIRGRKRNTREEYLMGGRRLKVIPVTLSLYVTYISSTAFIGMPAETFTTGFTFALFALGNVLAMSISIFTVVPMMHALRVTSVYEYFHLRFRSVALRRCISVVGMLQNIFYTAVVLLSPAMAIETVAGLPLWVSVLLVGAIATLYTAIGGLRGVVVVDVFQALVMVAGVCATVLKGVYEIGGFGLTWDLARQGGRLPPVDFSLDPRVRHSFWALVVGGGSMYVAYVFDQSAIQRICALPTVRQAKLTFAITTVVTGISFVTLSFLGLVAYSYYTVQGCDPFKAGYLQNRNQLVPYFVMEIFNGFPGMSGLFLATIFSAALSSVSSVINGLAANTIEDLLRPVFDRYNTSEKGKILTAKISVFIYGGLCVGLSFVARTLPGTIVTAAIGFVGACAGPVFGIFLLGALTPWGNISGAVSGLVVSLVLNVWITLGGIMYGRRPVPLPPAPGNSCVVPDVANMTGLPVLDPLNNMAGLYIPSNNSTGHADISPTSAPIPDVSSGGNPLYDISYMNYAVTGWVIALLVGLVVSLATKRWHEPVRDEKLLIPFVRRFWRLNQGDVKQTVELKHLDEGSVEEPHTKNLLKDFGIITTDML
ncbi:sodium-coupled monocarboxylate transporter 1-like [Haliotis rubra]|uniref:sodium-coupled monocarboxylate transporter 1-like n=1 Tax=Haliotis rubra TaxID=36100 RepID=UPI001EE5E7F1|nr:sodium-coupled monocarboxylate transporter 1-like [Haliotis rubra]